MPPFSLLLIATPLTVLDDRNLTLLYILEFEVSYAPGFVSYHEPPSERLSIPDTLNPLLTRCSGIDRLFIRLKPFIIPSYLALDVFLSLNSRDTSATFPVFSR